ncbi:MAG: hypothetical protein JO266_17435 [Acidobacteria bacterium]|nr:hypothetical protein [Acidobacteriota bacterium]
MSNSDGSNAIQLTSFGGPGVTTPRSTDGKFLYYTKALFATSLWKIPTEGGQPTKVLEGLRSYISLAIVDRGAYFLALQKFSTIQFLSFTTNQVRPVATLEKPIEVPGAEGGLAVSPDGRWILCTQFDQAGSELMLVDKFH